MPTGYPKKHPMQQVLDNVAKKSKQSLKNQVVEPRRANMFSQEAYDDQCRLTAEAQKRADAALAGTNAIKNELQSAYDSEKIARKQLDEVLKTNASLFSDIKMLNDINHKLQRQVNELANAKPQQTPDKTYAIPAPSPDNTDTAGSVTRAGSSDATTSHVALRYDLIPRTVIERLAAIYTIGAKKHGEQGHKRGFHDRLYIIDRINHLYEHLQKALQPKRSELSGVAGFNAEDDLAAAMWGIALLMEVEKTHYKGIADLLEDLAPVPVPKQNTDYPNDI